MQDVGEAPPPLAPWLEREIENAVAPYAGKVTPAELEWMKEQLRVSATSGAAKRFARGAEPKNVVISGEIAHDELQGQERTGDPLPRKARGA